jgi:hypothetical protein
MTTNQVEFITNDAFAVQSLADFKNVELSTDQFLVRKIEKGTGKESKGVVIPKMPQEVFITALDNETIFNAAYDWFLSAVEDTCKARIATGATTIIPADYSLESVAEYLQAQAIREGRISKEKIEQWFNSSVLSVLQAAFKEKVPGISDEKLTHTCNAYRDSFKLLAKRDVVLPANVRTNLEKAISLLPESDQMVQYCKNKISAEVKELEMLEL